MQLEEHRRIILRKTAFFEIVQHDILHVLRHQLFQQSCFADLPRSGDNDARVFLGQRNNLLFQIAFNIVHRNLLSAKIRSNLIIAEIR